MPRFTIRSMMVVTVALGAILAVVHLNRPSPRELQEHAVNDAIRRHYPPGTDFTKVYPDFQCFIGKPTSDFPNVIRVAVDVTKLQDEFEAVRSKRPNIAMPYWYDRILDYPNPDNKIRFHCLSTKRGDLTGYDAFQDFLILCVSDDTIVDVIQVAATAY